MSDRRYHGYQWQQLTSSGTVKSFRPANCCQLILPNHFLDGFPDLSQFAAANLTHELLIKAATTLGLLAIMATHPALMRCTSEPWPYYKVSMSGVCSQCHKSWGELFVQSLFWLGTFNVFWSSKHSGVQVKLRGVCISCSPPPIIPKPQSLTSSIPTQVVDGNSFTSMQLNANDTGNKLTGLCEFL